MVRFLVILALSLILSGCGGGGTTGPAEGHGDSASNRGPFQLSVRVDTGRVRGQTIGPLSTIVRVKVELLGLNGNDYLSPREVMVEQSAVSATFSPVEVGSYTIRVSGFNTNQTLVAGPLSQSVQVSAGQATSASFTLSVPPVEKDFLFASTFDDSIYVFQSNPTTGVLTQTPNAPFALPTGAGANELVSGPGGRFLYCDYANLDQVARFSVDPATGDVSALDTVATGDNPAGMDTDPQKEFLFVPNRNDRTISVYRISQTDGTLSQVPGSPFVVAGATTPQRVYTDPQGRFLFITDFALVGELFVMRIDRTTGALTQTVGPFQAFPVAFRTFAVTTNPAGTILYVAGNFNDLAVFDINQTTGFLTARPNVPAISINVGELIFDATRQVLYAVGFSDDLVRTFQLDAADNIGAEIAASPVLTGGINPLTAILTPDKTRLYVANFQTTGQVSAFLPGQDGSLTPVAGQPYPCGSGPFGIEFLRLQSFP